MTTASHQHSILCCCFVELGPQNSVICSVCSLRNFTSLFCRVLHHSAAIWRPWWDESSSCWHQNIRYGVCYCKRADACLFI